MTMSPYQQYIHMSRYSRFLKEKGRREFWPETVGRYYDYVNDFLHDHKIVNGTGYDLPIMTEIKKATLNLEVMPSMRSLMTAGPALARENIAGFNCAYLEINSKASFSEILYILMCGTGVGFSVERQVIKHLPSVPEIFVTNPDTTIVVEDSKEGWAQAYAQLIDHLYAGRIPNHFDVSRVRPAGAELKTFGGRASGPEPLLELFHFTIDKFRKAAGRKLNSLECHDIACKIGVIVVVGGVRRSAMISLSNLSDDRMRMAKSGQWMEQEKQRALSNNSIAFTEKPEVHSFMQEWLALYDSKSGERGIFSRYGAQRKIAALPMRDSNHDFGLNPCAEIILRPNQLCNLTEVTIREFDTPKDILRKIEYATILGTIQSMWTNFQFVNSSWAKNCDEERLLGVSLTGIMDNTLTSGQEGHSKLVAFLEKAKAHARAVNLEWSRKLGIPASAAITTVKPSGTVSQLVMSGSGIHPWHDRFYIRTVRADNKDPLCQFLKETGITNEPESNRPNDMTVFSFPMKAPESAILRSHLTAIQHLELVKIYNDHWTEHNTSVTINIREEEWPEVGGWVYKNFDTIAGMSFLPYSEHVYTQAPYQSIDELSYHKLASSQPQSIDWNEFQKYENGIDRTQGSQTLACSGNVCEIVDIESTPLVAGTAEG
jgi:ribonucleoside-triphosphate reductase